MNDTRFIFAVATVLTACGIETITNANNSIAGGVATVLTACGIETITAAKTVVTTNTGCNSAYRLRY